MKIARVAVVAVAGVATVAVAAVVAAAASAAVAATAVATAAAVAAATATKPRFVRECYEKAIPFARDGLISFGEARAGETRITKPEIRTNDEA